MATARIASDVMAWWIRPQSRVTRARAADRAESPSWEALERQDWHLWVLAVLLMFILGVSLLSFMLPAAFWFPDQLALQAPHRAFIGFSVLLALSLIYMIQRQAAVRRLKRELFQALGAASEAQRETAIQVFQALPEVGQFHDALAMDYRRASTLGTKLALVLLRGRDSSPEELGRAARTVRGALRRNETMFRLSARTLGMILPGMAASEAAAFAEKAFETITPPPEKVTVIAYPEETASLAGMEGRVRNSLDEKTPAPGYPATPPIASRARAVPTALPRFTVLAALRAPYAPAHRL